MNEQNKKTILLLVDGFGLSTSFQNNAIPLNTLSNFQELWKKLHHECLVSAIPENSGEKERYLSIENCFWLLSLGYQLDFSDLKTSSPNQLFESLNYTKDKGSALHLIFTFSKQSLEIDQKYLFQIVKLAKQSQNYFIYIHLLVDDSFVDAKDLLTQLNDFQAKLDIAGAGEIISLSTQAISLDKALRQEAIKNIFIKSGRFFISPEQAVIKNADSLFAKPSSFNFQKGDIGKVGDFDVFIFANTNNLLLKNFSYDFVNFDNKSKFNKFTTVFASGATPLLGTFSLKTKLFDLLLSHGVKSRLIESVAPANLNYWCDEPDKFDLKFAPALSETKAWEKFYKNEILDFKASDDAFLLIHSSDLLESCSSGVFSSCVKAGQNVNLLIRTIFNLACANQIEFCFASPFGMAESLNYSKEMLKSGFATIPTDSATPFLWTERDKVGPNNAAPMMVSVAMAKHDLSFVRDKIISNFSIERDK